MARKKPKLTPQTLARYIAHLREQERSAATIQKYARNLHELMKTLDGAPLTKQALVDWKQKLISEHAPATVNTMLAAVNGYLKFIGFPELCVAPLRIQRQVFLDENKELTRAEYERLVRAARMKRNERLSLVIQTICATGIRVSELRFITVEAVQKGRAEITNKGKTRLVFLPEKLRALLKSYCQKQKRAAGAVFVTKSGQPLNRSNIWRDMKALCERAGVAAEKVFPHNLRHLFARTFYNLEHDLSRLADILGHSSIMTTRIYTAESGAVHARQIERLGLVMT